MKRMYVICGAPGIGKSYWISKHKDDFKGTNTVVSRDQIRFSLVGENEPYFSKEKEVFQRFIREITAGIEKYDNVFVDATHLNEASRSKLLRNLGTVLKGVEVNAVMIKAPIERAFAQNALRAETRAYVPHSVIVKMYSQLTEPEFEEGFDNIYIVNPEIEEKCTVRKKV